MKKRLVIMLCLAVVVCAAVILALSGTAKRSRPFRELEASDVASATLRLLPPDETIRIDDPEPLIRLLRQLVVYEEVSSLPGTLSGQSVIVSLTLSNGERTEIEVLTPYLVIDGTGCRAKYGPCEALSRYANRLSAGAQAITKG